MSDPNAKRAWLAADTDRAGVAVPNSGEGDRSTRTLRTLGVRLVLASVLILFAGFALARTAEVMAEQTGLGESFFAVIFLAFATSLPEWSTVLAAVRIGRVEMASFFACSAHYSGIGCTLDAHATARAEWPRQLSGN
jgi:cation:H+ antiporter